VLNAQPPVATLGELADQRYVTVGGRTSLFDVLARMRAHGAHIALVSDSASTHFAEQIKGVITRVQLADAMVDGAELYVD
jgi:CBS domain-containing protein